MSQWDRVVAQGERRLFLQNPFFLKGKTKIFKELESNEYSSKNLATDEGQDDSAFQFWACLM